MNNTLQNYGHYEFEELLKEAENQLCFDCGKTPAHWASVNNAIFLCLNCAGEHRGYGVAISYVRSITIDTWNNNQISMMKHGGNVNLRELLEVYGIDKNKVEKSALYKSRILDFYRRLLKSKFSNDTTFDNTPPGKEEALKSLLPDSYNTNISDPNKYSSVSKNGVKANNNTDEKFKSISSSDVDDENVDPGFRGALNNWMSKPVNSIKFIANKVGEMEIGSKIYYTGSAITETGSNIVTKGTEFSVYKLYLLFYRKVIKSNHLRRLQVIH